MRAADGSTVSLDEISDMPETVRQLGNAVQQSAALARIKPTPEPLVRDAITSESDVIPSYNGAHHHFESG